MLTTYEGLNGVLPDTRIRDLIRLGHVDRTSIANVGSSSLDASISTEMYIVPVLPLPRKGESIRELIKSVRGSRHDISDPLYTGQTYIIRLNEKVNLPEYVRAYVNPKSTTGRTGVHVQLLADGVPAYDTIPAGYKGDLWLEVKPLAFPVLVREGLPLNQIRFFGSDTRIQTKNGILAMEEKSGSILFGPDGLPIPLEKVADHDGSVPLVIDLQSEIVGYEALATHHVLDMSATNLDWKDFWRPISKPSDGKLFLAKDRFYLLSSIEKVRVPITHACEMRPIDPRVGNFRSHFAGYIDDGWGGADGSTLTLEVQPFYPMCFRIDQVACWLVYEAMAELAEKPYTKKASNYVGQSGVKLGKQFSS